MLPQRVELRLVLFEHGAESLLFGLRHEIVIDFDRREEDRLHPVVVRLGNRVELVVVAARALQREAEHSLRGRGDHVVEVVEAVLGVVLLAKLDPRSGAQEPSRCLRVESDPVQLVAGELLHEEHVVGRVPVEGLDHVVAVPPGVRAVAVVLEPG